MHVARVSLTDCERHGRFGIFAIGDLHADSKAFQEDRLRQWVQFICRYRGQALAICVGDYANGQTPGHKHFDTDATRIDYLTNMDSYVKHSLAHVERLLKPLQEVGIPLVFVEGNHDRMMGWVGYTAMLSDRLGGHFLGNAGFVQVHSGDGRNTSYTTTIFAHHGSKGGTTPGPKVNAMQGLITAWDADCYIAGHVHDADLRIIPRYGVARFGSRAKDSGDGHGVTRKHVALYRAPSFLDRVPEGYSTYADRKEYGTADEGLMWAEYRPRARVFRRHEFIPKRSAA